MSRPIRFLQVTTFYPPFHFGGDAMYVYRLAHALGDRGHHVDVVHCVDAYRLMTDRGPVAGFRDHPNVTVHALRSALGRLSPLLTQQTGQPLLKRRALRAMLGRQVDVVHFHNTSLFGPSALALDPPASSGPPPVKLYTTHEYWLICPTHLLWKYGERLCDRPTCFSCTLAARRPPQLWRYTDLMARSARHVDRFLSPSRFAARMHAERGFNQPLTHLPPCARRVDDDWQSPGPRPHARPYFVYVGRLEAIKGIAALVRAWPSSVDVDLLVVGDGSERSLVNAAAARNPRIVVCGMRAPYDLGPYYAHALACIVPSVTYEVAPTVVLEAFARRTPVIARDLGGTAELVRESDGGLLYSTDEELHAAVARLARNESERRDFGERGYRAFVERWTEEAHLAAYLRIVDDAAAGKHARVPWRDGAPAPAAIAGPR